MSLSREVCVPSGWAIIIGALVVMLPACSHKKLPDDFHVAVPAPVPPVALAEIPLGIGDVLEVSYFKSRAVGNEPYLLGSGDALEVVVSQGNRSGPYRLATGDQFDVIVKAAVDGRPYRLQTGDEIRVNVPRRDDLSHTTVILPDGTAVLPMVGPVGLRGLTIPEAVDVLGARYGDQLDEPQVDLLVVRQVPDLRQQVTILPDGSGTMPLLGPVPVRGKTIEEAVRDLSDRYQVYFSEPQIDLLVSEPNPSLRYDATLLPDGIATLPLVGPIRLGGMSVEDASEVLTERFSAVLGQVTVDVLVPEPGARVDDFFEILQESPLGAVRAGTVTDDGYVRLPLIPPIEAADHLFSDVSERIAAAYAEVLPEVEVSTVFAVQRSQRKVTVVGEVVRAGMFDVVQPISALQAIALGGGFTDRAYRGQVLLVSPDYRERTLTVRVVDMTKGLKMEDPSLLATTVRANDIVYVPRQVISDLNLFVQQYIVQMIPFNLRLTVVVGGQSYPP